MSFRVAEIFVRRYGYPNFLWLVEVVNLPKDKRPSQRAIAEHLGISPARVCQLMHSLFDDIHVLKPGAIEYLEFHSGTSEYDLKTQKRLIETEKKRRSELRLVKG